MAAKKKELVFLRDAYSRIFFATLEEVGILYHWTSKFTEGNQWSYFIKLF